MTAYHLSKDSAWLFEIGIKKSTHPVDFFVDLGFGSTIKEDGPKTIAVRKSKDRRSKIEGRGLWSSFCCQHWCLVAAVSISTFYLTAISRSFTRPYVSSRSVSLMTTSVIETERNRAIPRRSSARSEKSFARSPDINRFPKSL